MWKQILSPVLFVVLIWLTTSGATTYYLIWLEQSYQRDFSDHVASIRAANRLERALWRMTSTWPSDDVEAESFIARWPSFEAELLKELNALKLTLNTNTEQEQFDTLLVQFQELKAFLQDTILQDPVPASDALYPQRFRLYSAADQITNTSTKLRQLNQQLLDEEANRRNDIRNFVLVTRITLLLAGPVVGIYLGWRISQKLHQSFAKISVTLSDERHRALELGSVAITSGDWTKIQQQAEAVIDRLHEVHGELQAARREVIRSERLAAVGELAAGVAHELRNPLTSVKLLLQHASRLVPPLSLSDNQWQLILDEVERMETTIQGLLDYARPQKLHRVPHEFRNTLQRAINLVAGRAHQSQIHIISDFCNSSCLVNGDTEKLHQLCVNLLLNGIEAMPHGGNLCVRLERNGTDQLILQIQDTGAGIAAELIPRLFEPFATTKEHGTGLGLAISQRIAAEHAGSIAAENIAEGGALFTVTLPLENSVAPLIESSRKEIEEQHGDLAGHR